LNRVQDDSEVLSLGDWRIETEKLEGAGLGKEEDFGHMELEFEFWAAFQLEMSSLQGWRNSRIGNVYLEFKL